MNATRYHHLKHDTPLIPTSQTVCSVIAVQGYNITINHPQTADSRISNPEIYIGNFAAQKPVLRLDSPCVRQLLDIILKVVTRRSNNSNEYTTNDLLKAGRFYVPGELPRLQIRYSSKPWITLVTPIDMSNPKRKREEGLPRTSHPWNKTFLWPIISRETIGNYPQYP